MSTAVFFIAGGVALVAGIAMISARNAVHAALFLVGSQLAIAVLFALQGAFFVAALQVIVYAGAIMVLFVFVVMLLGVDKQEALIEPLSYQRQLALGLSGILVGILAVIGLSEGGIRVPAGDAYLPGEGNVEAVARELFTNWTVPFELTSVLLIVAIVGVMVLARRELPR